MSRLILSHLLYSHTQYTSILFCVKGLNPGVSDSEDDYRTGCQNISHCQQQQSYSGLCSPGRSNSTYITGKNSRFPILDILGYLKNIPTKIPNLAKWDKSQPRNSQPSSLVGTCLTLPNLGFLWVFFKYPKISKNGNLLLFPVHLSIVTGCAYTKLRWSHKPPKQVNHLRWFPSKRTLHRL